MKIYLTSLYCKIVVLFRLFCFLLFKFPKDIPLFVCDFLNISANPLPPSAPESVTIHPWDRR